MKSAALAARLPAAGTRGQSRLTCWGIFGRSTVLQFEYHGVWPGWCCPQIQNVAKVRQVLAGSAGVSPWPSERLLRNTVFFRK